MSPIQIRHAAHLALLVAIYALFCAHLLTHGGVRDLIPSVLMSVFVFTLIGALNAEILPALWFQRRVIQRGEIGEDERDMMITLKAERVGGVSMLVCVVGGLLLLIAARMFPEWALPVLDFDTPTELVFAGVTIVFVFLTARCVTSLVLYRQ